MRKKKINEELVEFIFNCLLDGTITLDDEFVQNGLDAYYFSNLKAILAKTEGTESEMRSITKEMREAEKRYKNLPLMKVLDESSYKS
jgi:hypothetical protein